MIKCMEKKGDIALVPVIMKETGSVKLDSRRKEKRPEAYGEKSV